MFFGFLVSITAQAANDCSIKATAAVKSCKSRIELAKIATTTDKAFQKAEDDCKKKDQKICIDQCSKASIAASKKGDFDLSDKNEQIESSCMAQIGDLIDAADVTKQRFTMAAANAADIKEAACAVFENGECQDNKQDTKTEVRNTASTEDSIIAKPICFNQDGVMKTTLAVPVAQLEQGRTMIKNGYFGPDATIVPCP
jgi:hypothetical protein